MQDSDKRAREKSAQKFKVKGQIEMPQAKLPKDGWAVVHHIHVRTPHRHIAKLFVTDVPKGINAAAIQTALTRSGYVFQEFNIPFANHYIEPLTDVADEVVGAWRNGTARAITWDSICEDEQ
ncbi:MAG: hypothetical protein BroJett039_04520 [Chloroflexota bacterium]|nr:MAG: hypothetical protein BroJett039_04520 [Chloroflexota bacterium]